MLTLSPETALPTSTLEFDPNMRVAFRSDSDPQNEAVIEELHSGVLQSPDFRSVTTLGDGGASVTRGKFTFSIAAGKLRDTVADLCAAAGMRKADEAERFFGVRLCITRTYVKLSTVSPSIFFERTLFAHPRVEGLADNQKVALELDLNQLRKLPRSLKDESLTVIYDAASQRLVIRSDVASATPVRLKLDVRATNLESLSAETAIGPVQFQGQLASPVLREAIRFGQLFAKRDVHQPARPAIQISDGQSVSYLHERVGVLSSSGLRGVRLGVRFKQLKVLEKLLQKFGPDTYLYDAANHHVLYDKQNCVAFEKTVSLQSLPAYFTRDHVSLIRISRSCLLKELALLQVVSHSELCEDFNVTFRVEGSGGLGLLYLQSRDEGGKSYGVGALSCHRLCGPGQSSPLPQFKRAFYLQTLHQVISHFQSANVDIEELAGGDIRIQDGEPNFDATSWIACR